MHRKNTYTLVSGDIFERLTSLTTEIRLDYNYCESCNIPMTLNGGEYTCSVCGSSIKYLADSCKDHNEASPANMRGTTGTNRGKYYNISCDYSKTQKKLIYEQLIRNYNDSISDSTYSAPPKEILEIVASKYNSIQKLFLDNTDVDGNVTERKFVHRGNIKDEVLASLIYNECMLTNAVRKKQDIAKFMKLSKSGFARGESILCDLQAQGKIHLQLGEENIDSYISKYLETLSLSNYPDLIHDIVTASETHKICMSSQISSKVVGAIWNLILHAHLKISALELEKAADHTKKNTFVKFHKAILANPLVFGPIYKKYNL